MADLIEECISVDVEKRPSTRKVAEVCREMSLGYVDRVTTTYLARKVGDLRLSGSREATVVPVSAKMKEKLDEFLKKKRINPSTAMDDDLWQLHRRLVYGCHHTPSCVTSYFDVNLAAVKQLLSL